MNVGLFTSVYFNNIGNGFIDLGAEATLKEALPNSYKLVKISQCANFAASMSKSFAIKENPVINWVWVHTMQKFASKLHDKTYKTISTLDVISVPQMATLDYLVIPGCVLTVPFFTIYGSLLEKKVSQGCKIIFLGVSGNFYTEYEIKFVSQYLEKLNPLAIITRDSVAYKNYKNFATHYYNGIDNVFFVNKLEIPDVPMNPEKYVVVNIEESKHKSIRDRLLNDLKKTGENIIYTNHKPYPYAKVSEYVKSGVIVSDYPLDYLLLYKNASAVYSDRVHACIPTISFGNPAILYSDSPRKALFENVGITKFDDKPLKVDNLTELQNKQIDFLRNLFKKV